MFDDFDDFTSSTIPSLSYISLKNKNGVAIMVGDEACSASRFVFVSSQCKILAYVDKKIVAEIKLKKSISGIISKNTLIIKINKDGIPYSEHKLDI